VTIPRARDEIGERPDRIACPDVDVPARRGMFRRNAGPGDQPRLPAVLVEEIHHRERQVARVGRDAQFDAGDNVLFGVGGGQPRRQRPQRRQTPFADDPLGLLGDHAEVAGDVSLVVGERAVREGVIGLLGIAAPFEEYSISPSSQVASPVVSTWSRRGRS